MSNEKPKIDKSIAEQCIPKFLTLNSSLFTSIKRNF